MIVVPVACLRDNYAYVVSTGVTNGSSKPRAFVVDPSEAAPVEQAIDRAGWELTAVLATHHHLDHVGGILDLARAHRGLEVYGYEGDAERIDGLTNLVRDGDQRTIAGIDLEVRHIPGHTLGAISWFARGAPNEPPAVFTGDTMFIAGCGRLFEGTPADMYRSLVAVIGTYPDDTQVFCGHEYTESNLRFAAHVEPSNADVIAWQSRASELRAKGLPTVPSTLADERKINPFLRASIDTVRAFTKLAASATQVEVLGAVRSAKDSFLEGIFPAGRERVEWPDDQGLVRGAARDARRLRRGGTRDVSRRRPVRRRCLGSRRHLGIFWVGRIVRRWRRPRRRLTP